MADEKNPKLFSLGIYPKCPFYKPVPVLIILVLVSLGTIGIYFLNYWVAVGYLVFSTVFYFLVMPFTMCKYCYFRVKETSSDEEKGTSSEKLLSVEKWSESHLHLHVGQKGWAFIMAIVWLSPIVLISASFFLNYSVYALLSLICFAGLMASLYRSPVGFS